MKRSVFLSLFSVTFYSRLSFIQLVNQCWFTVNYDWKYFAKVTHYNVLFLQVYTDDVLTKEEQISLLFTAKQKCEGIIKAKHKIPGEQKHNTCCAVLIQSVLIFATSCFIRLDWVSNSRLFLTLKIILLKTCQSRPNHLLQQWFSLVRKGSAIDEILQWIAVGSRTSVERVINRPKDYTDLN